MNVVHTKSLYELKIKYMERSIELSKVKTEMWTPLRWQTYRNRPLKKRGVISDIEAIMAVKSAYLPATCLVPDKELWVTDVQDYKDFLALDDTDKYQYIAEVYDCNDFAWRLMGKLHHPLYGTFAHGIAWSVTHAFNCFIDWKNQLYIIEPQTDDIMKAPVEEDMYKINLVMM